MVRLWEPSRTGEASLQNLTFAVKIVRYCGLWRSDGDSKSYMLYTLVMTLTFIFTYLKILFFCFTAADGLAPVIDTLSMIFGLTPTFVGMFFIMTFRRKFSKIIERIRAFIYFVHAGEEHWKYESRRNTTTGIKRLTMYYLVTCQMSVLNYLLRPVVTHLFFGKEAEFPIEQLTMFDDNDILSFFIQYLAQIFFCIILWSAATSFDVLCFNIIVSCSHQLKLLSSMIMNVANGASGAVNITREYTRAESDFEQSPLSSEHLDMLSHFSKDVNTFRGCYFTAQQQVVAFEELIRIEGSLAKLSLCHMEILKIAEETAKLLNVVMLSHYLFTSITICMFTYNVQNYKDQSQLISTGSLLIVVFFRIFIFGWVSSELSSESLSVADAVYFCNWYDLSLSAKKTLIIMMARAQRPVIIKAGPTGSLSLETCKKLLEAAYSYLNLLNNMK